MLKVINIAENNKFINFAIAQFEQLKDINCSFYIIQKSFNPNFIKYDNVKYFNNQKELIDSVNQENPDYVILHSLYFMNLNLLCNIKPKIIGCTWGYDIYSDKNNKFIQLIKILETCLYKDNTKKLLNNTSIFYKLHTYYRKIKHLFIRHQYWYNKLINKLSYISTILPYEYELIKEKLPNIQYFPFKYINPIDNNINFNENKNTKPIILLGNSADPTNNHADILKILEERQIKCTAYIPFSYPYDVDIYKNNLKKYSESLKYVKCIFLETYMDRDEYFKLLNNCSCAIYGFTEQQAIGNIYQMFRTGKKVFFFKDSKMYKYFISQKLNIYNIENDLNTNIFNTDLFTNLQQENYNYVINDENYINYISNLQLFFNNLPH